MVTLVTDGNTRAALAITRSLGRSGRRVIVGDWKQPCLASKSRYCSGSIRYPNPMSDTAGFLRSILETVKRERIELIIPVTEVSTLLIAEHRAVFEGVCRVPFADFAALDFASDKRRLLDLACTLGVPIPRTTVLESPEMSREFVEQLTFPLVIKPSRSRVRGDNGWSSTEVTYAQDLQDLRAQIAGKSLAGFPVLLQEKIAGPGIGAFALYDSGVPLVIFAHRRLREKPPSGGVSVLRESIAVPDDLRDYTGRLLGRLRWHGVAMVEFKRDARDDKPKLMEINARFWGSLQLAIDAGVDFPSLLADMAFGERPSRIIDYQTGVRTRWLWGDIDSLLMCLRGSAKDPFVRGSRSRTEHIMEFLRTGGKDVHYEIESLHDPGPGLYESVRWFGSLFSRVDT
jgi:predicted ATP-grasp superfamily ATP-dependent carboligase